MVCFQRYLKMKEIISVTQLNKLIKDMFTQNRLLYNMVVKGEISNFKESHGNYYFSLKDEESQINCILFSNYANQMPNDIHDGMKVTVTGRVSVYEKNGTYAIYANKIENTGLGEYFIKLQELKNKLSEMGMFDDSYKKLIPKYSMKIGIVTAKNGAAIKDIVKTIRNKNPYAKMYLYPSMVQGDMAYKSIVDGIMVLDKMNLDVIIIGRGGGSIEDLYCFNDERVAYAIFNAFTPIISAVGHEINDSISDLVADLRVATPTAAGEASTFSYKDFVDKIEQYNECMRESIYDKINDLRNKIESKKVHIELLSPKTKVLNYKKEIKYRRDRLNFNIQNKLNICKSELDKYIEMIKSRDVLNKLGSGFASIANNNGKKIKSIKEVKVGMDIFLRIKDGNIKSKVVEVNK